MKDYKYTNVNKRVRLREWPTGDYGITFLGGGSHGHYFEFLHKEEDGSFTAFHRSFDEQMDLCLSADEVH